MSASSIIKVVVTGDVKGLHRATDDALKDVQRTGKESSGMGKKVAAGFAVGAGAALAFGVQAVEAADVADKAHVRLETAVKNAGDQYDKFKGQIKGADDQGQQFGYDQGQIEAALAGMTTGLGSTHKALGLLPLAENIAAQTGMDLASSGLLVTKAAEGQTKALKRLGIDLPVAAGGAVKLKTAQDGVTKAEAALQLVEEKIHDGRLKGPAAADALRSANQRLRDAQQKVDDAQSAGVLLTDALTKKYQGAAGREADTFAGKVAAQAAAWRNIKIQAGQAIEKGLLRFQVWSQKTGRPEIMRLQGDLNGLANEFNGVADAVDGLTTKVANFFSKAGKSFGGIVFDNLNPNAGQGTPGAAQRDRARLDQINRSKNSTGSTGGKAHRAAGGPVAAYGEYTVGEHGSETLVMGAMGGTIVPHGAGRGGGVVYATINVHSADPNQVTQALQRFARRNGVRVR